MYIMGLNFSFHSKILKPGEKLLVGDLIKIYIVTIILYSFTWPTGIIFDCFKVMSATGNPFCAKILKKIIKIQK